jgi:GMP synthase-like glutamine amidotransferase
MRVHWLQHADHEDPGTALSWLKAHGHTVQGSLLHRGQALPALEDFELLIVMGGPMNIYEHARHPWLVAEKQLIRRSLDGGKRLLGICLGAQLIADQLGGPVTRNTETECGWWPVRLTTAGRRDPLFANWPDEIAPFHWHGDTFALPPGCASLAASDACEHQAFSYDEGRVLGLQFHPEVRADMLQEWFGADPPPPGRWVQMADAVLGQAEAFARSEHLLAALLARFLA